MKTSLKLSLLGFGLALAATACSSSVKSVSSVSVSPSICGVTTGQSTQLSAEATMDDGTKEDASSSASWTSGNTSTATVNGSGVVVGVAVGITAITAEYGGKTGSSTCTVGP